ncbi:DUF3265 domain-containing protein [Vibrio sp. D401a]|uniref:DUF3265 domain-containing protein n=1 Tax=Vibrio rotiferianus TaxID=190895 RepID=A0A7Y4E098_9VIBR|nr:MULTISPECIES: DUF3265 domain-containing protein [Vibrio]MDK9777961.1 DUF3265 domain-containing protein [Vibrio sp. D401a]MDK9805811.1 DUF3265 domain-containing protein [Vibrio sp. D406a]NOH46840.1 DUF3265 domain-containing protein [Vibrio rotiferianus]USD51198.1 DUF3265 domain-containing protein [Vibrio sp. SCSIO 43153]
MICHTWHFNYALRFVFEVVFDSFCIALSTP